MKMISENTLDDRNVLATQKERVKLATLPNIYSLLKNNKV